MVNVPKLYKQLFSYLILVACRPTISCEIYM